MYLGGAVASPENDRPFRDNKEAFSSLVHAMRHLWANFSAYWIECMAFAQPNFGQPSAWPMFTRAYPSGDREATRDSFPEA